MPPSESRPEGLRGWVLSWWRGEGGMAGTLAGTVLWPAEQLFRGVVAVRNSGYEVGLLRSAAAPIPVISVGNIGVGGAGKTPFAAWLAGRLLQEGRKPAIVLRGYGADEILVHRELNPGIPVFAAARRVEAVREAAEAGRDVAVLDDAFQHRAIARDLDIVLVPADGWTGKLRLLPRGPWREGLTGLGRADLVVVTAKAVDRAAAERVGEVIAGRVGAHRVVVCRLLPGQLVGMGAAEGDRRQISSLRGRRVLVVTSLADPDPFVAQLRAAGLEVELMAFRDHHAFTAEEAAGLVVAAGERPLVMTRKEAVKLRELLPTKVEGWMVEQQVRIETGEALLEAAWRRVLSG